jgi:hypothetical protein
MQQVLEKTLPIFLSKIKIILIFRKNHLTGLGATRLAEDPLPGEEPVSDGAIMNSKHRISMDME